MKYICLGYLESGKFEEMTEDERQATFDECFEYNDHLLWKVFPYSRSLKAFGVVQTSLRKVVVK